MRRARGSSRWPATTDPEHLAKLRADNEHLDRMNAHDPQGPKWSKMCPSIGSWSLPRRNAGGRDQANFSPAQALGEGRRAGPGH